MDKKTGIVNTLTVGSFRDAFYRMGRGDQFSYAGLGALFEYLENLSADMGEPIELDVIALCCEYSEHASLTDLKTEHDVENMADLENKTTVIRINDAEDGPIIIQAY